MAVIADDGTTYTTLTAWEATVGTVGGPGPICTVVGMLDETGVILDYTNNLLEDPSATFVYKITGGGIQASADSGFGVLNIVTSAILTDFTISGITAREAGNWVNKGIIINLATDETAILKRVKVYGLGELGGQNKAGIQCDGQTNATVKLKHCHVTDVRASGGNSAYGISFGNDNRDAITTANAPSLLAEFCTVDSISSLNSVSASPNESFGFNVGDTHGTSVQSCVSHKIDGGNSYFGGSANVLCYGGNDSWNKNNDLWGTDAVGGTRAAVGSNQSSDKTGVYAGVHNKDINVFNGAPGRPDPVVSFSASAAVHDLKIAQRAAAGDVAINGVYSSDNIGAFGTYRVINVGSDQTGSSSYSTLTSALIGARTNPTIGADGDYGTPYLLGMENYAHSGDTWAVFRLSGGEFTEQIRGGMLTSGGIGPAVTWAGNVFTGYSSSNRTVFRPGHEGYGDSLLDFVGNTEQQPTELIVQHIEVDMENNRWSHGIMASGASSGGLVHNCIVHGNGYLSGSTITESVEVGIAADDVTTSLVYGKISDGIHPTNNAYNNTVVLDNISLTGKGIVGGNLKNNLVLTSGTNFSNTAGVALGIDSGGGNGNISDSRTQVDNYFTDAANDDYTLKLNSHALDSGIVPPYSHYADFLPIWPYTTFSVTGVYTDRSHWFIDGGGVGGGDNRFSPDVAVSGFDTGWDERYEQRTEPQPPFIAFMDF
jgi:hypothetical protein